MRLTKEENYQIKLIRLAKDISRSNRFDAACEYTPYRTYSIHEFRVFSELKLVFTVCSEGFKTAEECYKWAFAECKKKGVIR